MKQRTAIDLVLLVVIAAGGVAALQTGRERSRLESTYERLHRKTGDLPIGDPAWVHVRAIETGDPLHFAWRVYFPSNYPKSSSFGSAGQSWSGSGGRRG